MGREVKAVRVKYTVDARHVRVLGVVTGSNRLQPHSLLPCLEPAYRLAKVFADLIGYDALSSYGSPSYYAQVMFSTHLGDQILNSKLDTTNPRLFSSATYDSKTHRLYLKLVNASSMPQPVEIKLTGAAHVHNRGTVITLSGKTTLETNTISEPTHIVRVAGYIVNAGGTFIDTIPEYSIQVLDIELGQLSTTVLEDFPLTQSARIEDNFLRRTGQNPTKWKGRTTMPNAKEHVKMAVVYARARSAQIR